jgi:hypothetical protein
MNSRTREIRRGVSVLIVLALLAITLAVSYAMMRTQSMNAQIHHNYQRRGDARQAAYVGLGVALRTMQISHWPGVDAPLSRNLGDGQSFTVTFETGDASLAPGSPAYADFPYRVTILSQGVVTDQQTSIVNSTHQVRAVVQFVPRKVSDPPANWSSLQNFTVYQWGSAAGECVGLEVPARMEGPVFAGGGLKLAHSYPGDGENRPFAGQIDEIVVLRQALSATTIANLANQSTTLSTVVANNASHLAARWRLDESAGSLIAQDELDVTDGLYDGAKPGGTPSPPYGGAASATFDGFNDRIHIDQLPLSGSELTILAWIRPTSFPSEYGRIISKTNNLDESSHSWMLGTQLSGSNQRLRFRLTTNVSGTSTLVATSGNLTAGNWVFAAAVYDGAQMRLYKDGALVGSTIHFGNIFSTSSKPVSIGDNPPGSPCARLLRDWNAMRLLLGNDYRPLTGPIHAPPNSTDTRIKSLCQDELQLTWNETASAGSAPIAHPGPVLTYRLYPGGKAYQPQVLEETLSNVTLQPDPGTNPLGIFYRFGSLNVYENVNVTGVLIIDGNPGEQDIQITGGPVNLQGITLPSLDGVHPGPQLPVAMVKDDFRIHEAASGSVQGLVAVWDECGFESGGQSTAFTILGKLVANTVYCESRSEWNRAASWWHDSASSFFSQLADEDPTPFFPVWLFSNHGLDPVPHLVIKPDGTNPSYHWHTWSLPVFVAHPDDGGLRWDVLEVRDVP